MGVVLIVCHPRSILSRSVCLSVSVCLCVSLPSRHPETTAKQHGLAVCAKRLNNDYVGALGRSWGLLGSPKERLGRLATSWGCLGASLA